MLNAEEPNILISIRYRDSSDEMDKATYLYTNEKGIAYFRSQNPLLENTQINITVDELLEAYVMNIKNRFTTSSTHLNKSWRKWKTTNITLKDNREGKLSYKKHSPNLLDSLPESWREDIQSGIENEMKELFGASNVLKVTLNKEDFLDIWKDFIEEKNQHEGIKKLNAFYMAQKLDSMEYKEERTARMKI